MFSIQFEGREYDVSDFTLGELEYIEDEMGCAISEVNPGSMKLAARFVVVLKRRDDPSFTVDQARAMTLSVFGTPDDEPDPERPTVAAEAA